MNNANDSLMRMFLVRPRQRTRATVAICTDCGIYDRISLARPNAAPPKLHQSTVPLDPAADL